MGSSTHGATASYHMSIGHLLLELAVQTAGVELTVMGEKELEPVVKFQRRTGEERKRSRRLAPLPSITEEQGSSQNCGELFHSTWA